MNSKPIITPSAPFAGASDGKALATARARSALAGFELLVLRDGRYALSRHCSTRQFSSLDGVLGHLKFLR